MSLEYNLLTLDYLLADEISKKIPKVFKEYIDARKAFNESDTTARDKFGQEIVDEWSKMSISPSFNTKTKQWESPYRSKLTFKS